MLAAERQAMLPCHRSSSRFSRKKPCRRLPHCSHSVGSSPGTTSSMRLEGDPYSAHAGVIAILVTMRTRWPTNRAVRSATP